MPYLGILCAAASRGQRKRACVGLYILCNPNTVFGHFAKRPVSLLCRHRIARIQLIILTLLLNQLIVRTALNDAPLLEHHDTIAVSYSR